MLKKEERNEIIDVYMQDDGCSIHDMCEAIERAVLAKAIAQQERLHKEWSELWSPIDEAVRPLTPTGESVAAKALELINTAKAMPIPKQEPVCEVVQINQDRYLSLTCVGAVKPKVGDKLYLCPQPAQAAAIPDGWQLVPVDPTPAMLKEIHLIDEFSERALIVRYKAMLSSSPKPE